MQTTNTASSAASSSEARFFSVSELNRSLNLVLESNIGVVAFEGEIAEAKYGSSGHLYCTLKDQNSQISMVLWAPIARGLTFKPGIGLVVRCHGKPNVYHKSGRLQMVVQKMYLAGEGLLQKKFLELRAKLEREGLFNTTRKRPLPFLPKAIGIVTSAGGAAIHDIMVKLKERMPQVPVYLLDVRVQGDGAAQEIAAGIEYISGSGMVDVVIAGRGGGSLEDLWAFNEEVVVRAVFGSKVPIISAVGHEVDISLSDLAADVRAPTPTAAAEMVVPRREDLLKKIVEFERRLLDYSRWFAPLQQQLDELSASMELRLKGVLEGSSLRLDTMEARLKSIEPSRLLQLFRMRVEALKEKLVNKLEKNLQTGRERLYKVEDNLLSCYKQLMQATHYRLETLSTRLEGLNPKSVLLRGYAIVEKGKDIVRSADEIALHEKFKVSFSRGAVVAEVIEKVK